MNKKPKSDFNPKRLSILGIRGIPACHGGFETFAERLALYLVHRGWEVTVFCQGSGSSDTVHRDTWSGVQRVTLPTKKEGAAGTVQFDWKSINLAARERSSLILTLGYNTASFCLPYRIKGIPNLINMDGIEWKRNKWRLHEKLWLWANERIGCWVGNHLIADHPCIADHLSTRVSRDKITTIPYGADEVSSADSALLKDIKIEPRRFLTVIARPERENSILEIVRAFSSKKRDVKLVVLGNYSPENPFHKEVLDAAGSEVLFPGAIYDRATVEALRHFGIAYIHGHTVGGTNPSLVEAMGAGSAILAHDNAFNKWVAGDGARYFSSEEDCGAQLDLLLQSDAPLEEMRMRNVQRFRQNFTWEKVLMEYEQLLLSWLPESGRHTVANEVENYLAVRKQ
ncbi:DUF1972 domain-containing protein [Cupriavidus basilensis]|uniref:DUF1972 domain-containing protein n=1 Tax=Cupriavidus basilensis TaxID=68895 RepID=UPI00157AA60B|nr:DUF1972 domain-containing protein [Cupriavidus basilensis]NUA29700.1 glycosyltransferase family 1 protein [Cupriavidus basilensis]